MSFRQFFPLHGGKLGWRCVPADQVGSASGFGDNLSTHADPLSPRMLSVQGKFVSLY